MVKEQTYQESARRTAEELARAGHEQTNRIARSAFDAGQHTLETSVEILRHNSDACQHMWHSGLELAKQITERSADQVARTWGLAGDEGHQAAEQSSRNLEAIVSSGNVVAQSLQGMSREWFDFSRQRIQQNLDQMHKLVSCRTPQEVIAVQSELWRRSIESLVQSGRKLSELSTRMTDESGRKITEKVRRAA